MHLYKQYLFKPQSVKLYSKQYFIVKFWSNVFEEVFSNSGLYFHWGDTKPKKAKKENIDMKIDLRVLYSMNTKQSDLAVGEFSKKAITSKLYNDKLKEVLNSKFHLNTLLLSGLPQATTFIPLIQIIGFNCQLCVLRHVEDFYVSESVDSFSFPTTHQDIKENRIKKLITCLETTKNLCLELKKAIKNNSLERTTSKMANILGDKEHAKNISGIRSMVWPSDSENEEDEVEEDGEDEEDTIQRII